VLDVDPLLVPLLDTGLLGPETMSGVAIFANSRSQDDTLAANEERVSPRKRFHSQLPL
jgi:hypothetical protein